MKEKNHKVIDALDGVIATAISDSLADKSLAKSVTKAVLHAIEDYEDDLFEVILRTDEDTECVDIETIRDALKS